MSEGTPESPPTPIDPSEKVAPFRAVRWAEETGLEVRLDDEWCRLIEVGSLDASSLLEHARATYGGRWLKRLGEDLPQVFFDMGLQLTTPVRVAVTRGTDQTEQIWRECTAENRKAALMFGREGASPAPRPAGSDVDVLAQLLHSTHSYHSLAPDTDWVLEPARECVAQGGDSEVLEVAIVKSLARLGDGHTRVRRSLTRILRESSRRLRNRPSFLPFSAVPLDDGRWVASSESGRLLAESHPFLIGLDGAPLAEWLRVGGAVVVHGAPQLRRLKISHVLREFHWLRPQVAPANATDNEVAITLSDGRSELTLTLDVGGVALADPTPGGQSTQLPDGVGYLPVAAMGEPDDAVAALEKLRDCRGLVVDLRGNAGGHRQLVRALVPHLLDAGSPSVVYNLAKKRLLGGERADEPQLLADRGLFPRTAPDQHDAAALTAIDLLASSFLPEWEPPEAEFSEWCFGVLSPGSADWHYRGPIAVLTDERCFSAGEIFATALLQAPNSIHIGRPTGGGSGRAVGHVLPSTGIAVQISSMASFQPSGRLYEKRGVAPRHQVPLTADDFLGTGDRALVRALELVDGAASV